MGRNGEGKSTLLRLIRGEIEPDEGEFIRQQGLVVSLLPQQVPVSEPAQSPNRWQRDCGIKGMMRTGRTIGCKPSFLD